MLQILQSQTKHPDHIFNRFMWGNKKSLQECDVETLVEDLREFFERNYSADRMKLVIQVRADDAKMIEI